VNSIFKFGYFPSFCFNDFSAPLEKSWKQTSLQQAWLLGVMPVGRGKGKYN